jgi:hypothetical protein
MTASRNDPVVAVDELGREIRMTRTGQRYLGTELAPTRPQATAGRGLGYNILDNIIGFDDGVDTPGERAAAGVQAIASDPIGAARGAATGIGGLLQRLVVGTGTMGDVIDATGLLNLGSVAGAAPRGALRSGAGRDAPQTPAQRVAGLLSSGRADEVTDEMMAAVDPQEMARLYASGATGMDLPMDEASRMVRAREMGFTDEGYHGSVDDILSFRPSIRGKLGPGVYTAPEAPLANSFAGKIYGEEEYLEGGNVLPLFVRSNPAPDMFRSEASALARAEGDPFRGAEMFTNYLDNLGFTGVKVNSEQTTLNPANVRSRFARFDPRLSHLRNLNAANASPLLGGAVIAAPQEQPDPLRNLRGLLAR